MNLNKVMLIGRVGQDPELKAIPSGSKVCSLSLATTKHYKDSNGAKQEATEWHNLIAWNKPAELIAEYVRKGTLLFVEGEIKTRSWEDKDTGKKLYRTEIFVTNFQLPPRSMSGDSSEREESQDNGLDEFVDNINGAEPKKPAYKKQASPLKKIVDKAQGKKVDYPEEEINAEDIPF